MILPRPCVWWDADLVPRPATILEAQTASTDPVHLVARLYAGATGEIELWGVPWCDAASPVAGGWSELA